MAKPFKSEKLDIPQGPGQPPATLITWAQPTSGGIPIGPAPGATDAVPGNPSGNVAKGK